MASERLAISHFSRFFRNARPRQQADLLIDAGCYEDAIPPFAEASVWRKVGDALWALGRLDEAEHYYARPSNQAKGAPFRSGPDNDRLMVLALVNRQWSRIPELIRSAAPRPLGKKDVIFGGSNRAKGPILRLLALAEANGATSLSNSEREAFFEIDESDWRTILLKTRAATPAEIKKEINKLRPPFLQVRARSFEQAIDEGLTDRAAKLTRLIAETEEQFSPIVGAFRAWRTSGADAPPVSVIYWLTASGIYDVFRSCLRALMYQVYFWSKPSINDAAFYSAHPWIMRACMRELLAILASSKSVLTPGILVSATLQRLANPLSFDFAAEAGKARTFQRLQANYAWAESRLSSWISTAECQNLYERFQQDSQGAPKFGDPRSSKSWATMIGAAISKLEHWWEEDFAAVRWVSEQALFLLIKEKVAPAIVEQHASPVWLAPQHFDVFIPEYDLAVEYQGLQHYEAIEIFGGKAGLLETRRRDQRKRAICEMAGIRLEQVRYDEDIGVRATEIAALMVQP